MTDSAVILRQLAAETAADADLLRRFAATRDGAAFAELVRRHGPVVLAACRRGVRHHHDAEDAFQAVFLVLARRAGSIRQPGLLASWLYRVAVGVTRNARRAAARRRVREVQVVNVPEPVAPPAATASDLGPVLDEELDALAAHYRDAVILCDLRGLSRAEAAAALGIPLGTLASRLDAARKKLAARLVRRGVALSVAAVLVEGRAAAVPDALFVKTCGLVADWTAGGAVPAAVLRFARGGATMRGVILGGVLALTLAAGVALAANFSDPPGPPAGPTPPPPEAAVAAPQPDPNPRPVAAEQPPAVKLGPPRLQRTADLKLRMVFSATWSRDGTWLAVAGAVGNDATVGADALRARGADTLVVLAPADPKAAPGQLPLPAQTELVGFTSDGKTVLVATRETGLISGEHLLHRMTVTRPPPRDPKGDVPPVVLDAAGGDPGSVPDGGERLTITGPQDVRFLVRGAGKVTVWHADLKFDSRWPLGGFDGTFSDLRLTPDGRRVIALAGGGAVEGYDALTGKQLWATGPAAKQPDVKLVARSGFNPESLVSAKLAVGLSGDGRRAVIARGRHTPVLVLDLDTGKALPLPADLGLVLPLGPVAVSGDGRLAAMTYTTLVPLDKEAVKGVGPPFAGATHDYGPTQLTVWETATGAVVRTWQGRAAVVAFHPTRPVLAVFEGHSGVTRLGLWDFAAQP